MSGGYKFTAAATCCEYVYYTRTTVGRSVGRSTVVLCDTEEQLATIMADRHSRRRVTFTLQTDRPTDSVEREKHATVSAQRRHEFNFTKTSLKDRLLQLPFPMHVLYVQLHHL